MSDKQDDLHNLELGTGHICGTLGTYVYHVREAMDGVNAVWMQICMKLRLTRIT
jgi:hypothetical protein